MRPLIESVFLRFSVLDVPNPPVLRWVDCGPTDADVVWQPPVETKAPLLSYTIQYSTTFHPDQWETQTGNKS